jgi:hypothetical protein
MLTEREILAELGRMGIKEPSLMEKSLKEFEEYMAENYGLKMIEEGKQDLETKIRIKKK